MRVELIHDCSRDENVRILEQKIARLVGKLIQQAYSEGLRLQSLYA